MPELDGPVCPPFLVYLLEWFAELSAARGSGVHGANPLSFAEIAAWASLTGSDPTPAEVHILRRIDAVFIAAVMRGASSG